MGEKRFLLPFTDSLDAHAIDHALYFARASQAVLVALGLIVTPAERSSQTDIRPEHIQQVKDFLEMVYFKADLHHVPLERIEQYTQNAHMSILSTAHKQDCQGILLVFSEKEARYRFLQEAEIKKLRQSNEHSLYILSLPGTKRKAGVKNFLSNWGSGRDTL